MFIFASPVSAAWGLPKLEHAEHAKEQFQPYSIGDCYVDIANVRTEEEKHHLLIPIDRPRPFVDAERHEKSDRIVISDCLSHLVKMVPYKTDTMLTDHGAPFCVQPRDRHSATARFSRHMCLIPCHKQGIIHRLTQPNRPSTNGKVERLNRRQSSAITMKRMHN